jgi:hypothetical protein
LVSRDSLESLTELDAETNDTLPRAQHLPKPLKEHPSEKGRVIQIVSVVSVYSFFLLPILQSFVIPRRRSGRWVGGNDSSTYMLPAH